MRQSKVISLLGHEVPSFNVVAAVRKSCNWSACAYLCIRALITHHMVRIGRRVVRFCVCVQDLRERFQGVSLAAAEAAYFSGPEAQGGVLAHLAAKLAAKLKVRVAVGSGVGSINTLELRRNPNPSALERCTLTLRQRGDAVCRVYAALLTCHSIGMDCLLAGGGTGRQSAAGGQITIGRAALDGTAY